MPAACLDFVFLSAFIFLFVSCIIYHTVGKTIPVGKRGEEQTEKKKVHVSAYKSLKIQLVLSIRWKREALSGIM